MVQLKQWIFKEKKRIKNEKKYTNFIYIINV